MQRINDWLNGRERPSLERGLALLWAIRRRAGVGAAASDLGGDGGGEIAAAGAPCVFEVSKGFRRFYGHNAFGAING